MAGAKRHNVAIAGFGGVGKATAEMLLERRARYRSLYDIDLRIVAVCGSKAGLIDADGLDQAKLQSGALKPGLTGAEFLANAPIDTLIEAGPTDFKTGGPAHLYIRGALSRGRHVIAISKGALVVSGEELRLMAKQNGARLKVSGATAAALPTIDMLHYNLLGCRVTGFEGILNGTTNYILTAMMEENIGFAQALEQAQRAGIAEPDPSFDVGGWDSACKLVIIANFGLGGDIALDDLSVAGIGAIPGEQLAYWRQERLTPRLVAHLAQSGEGWLGGVEVRAYRSTDPFALVSGKNKAIRIQTEEAGEILVAGAASGIRATAAAALKDLEHILAGQACI